MGYKIDHFVDIGQDLNGLNFLVFNSLSCIDDRVSYDAQLTNFLIEYVGKMAGTHQVSRQFLPRIVCVCVCVCVHFFVARCHAYIISHLSERST